MNAARQSLSANLAANLLGQGWGALMAVVFVPVYVQMLGIERFAIVALYSTVLILVGFADLGLGTVVNHEIARRRSDASVADPGETRALIFRLERVYWAMAVALGAIVVVLAPSIAQGWISPGDVGQPAVERAFVLMGVSVCLQMPTAFYTGALLGADRHVSLNALLAGAATARWGGAALALLVVSPTMEAFFLTQAFVSVIQVVLMRRVLDASLPPSEADVAPPPFGKILGLAPLAAKTNLLIILGVSLTQIDKVLLARTLSLQALGAYMFASLVASVLLRAAPPVQSALLPRLSALTGRAEESAAVYRAGCQIATVVLVPLALLLAVFGREFIAAWTGDAGLAATAAPALALLAAGNAATGLQYPAGALQYARGRLGFLLVTTGAALAAMAAGLVILPASGMVAAGLWLGVSVMALLATVVIGVPRAEPEISRFAAAVDMLLPGLAAASIALAMRLWMPLPDGRGAQAAALALLLALMVAGSGLAASRVRAYVFRFAWSAWSRLR